MASRIAIDPQRLLRIVGTVQQQLRTQGECALVLGVELTGPTG